MKNFMAIYPPGREFMRGEERCQSNIKNSTSTSMRACNDLGYAVAVVRKLGWNVFLYDYQTAGRNEENLMHDVRYFVPDVLFVSTTNATLEDDLVICRKIKQEYPDLFLILKSGIFFDPPSSFFDLPNLELADCLIAEEAECVLPDILENQVNKQDIPGIFFKDEHGVWQKSNCRHHTMELDSIPFPARDLMQNELYIRPDKGVPMATIYTSRGCPSSCTFCLTSIMSGKKVRMRSPENVVDEIQECCDKYGITEFFFRADTFTIQKKWVLQVCSLIMERNLNKKISWVANSRATSLDDDVLSAMKQAGCWLIAIGFESGNDETLKKTRKGTTVSDNLKAAELIHRHKIKLFGFYMIGFPWEKKKHIEETKGLIRKTKPDFLELHIATPFYGTPLYDDFLQEGLLQDQKVTGLDYFENTPCGTKYLSGAELQRERRKILFSYLFSVHYIVNRLTEAVKDPVILKNYAKYGFRLIGNLLKK